MVLCPSGPRELILNQYSRGFEPHQDQYDKDNHESKWSLPVGGLKANDMSEDVFVKPADKLKTFTGFRLQSDSKEREVFDSLSPQTMLWVSSKVEFVSEYRYYVSGPGNLKSGRYDEEGEDDAPKPNMAIVEEMARLLFEELGHPFALDVGVLSTGETALVEVNDAWAIGLYENALSPFEYYQFLCSRWESIEEGKV